MLDKVLDKVLIDTRALASIEVDVRRCYPGEAIGLLAGAVQSGQTVVVVGEAMPLSNRARNPRVGVRVSRAERDERLADLARRGLAAIGAYHSHPDGAAEPSAADLQAVRAAGVELIASATMLGMGVMRAWWLEPGRAPRELSMS